MEWFAALFKPVSDAFGLIFFAFFGGIVRTIYRPSSRKISSYFISVLISVPIGVLAGNIGIEYGFTDNTAKGMAVIAGIVAHDIIEAIFWTTDKLKSERDSLWKVIFSKITGGK